MLLAVSRCMLAEQAEIVGLACTGLAQRISALLGRASTSDVVVVLTLRGPILFVLGVWFMTFALKQTAYMIGTPCWLPNGALRLAALYCVCNHSGTSA